jgi:hypothetical protein
MKKKESKMEKKRREKWKGTQSLQGLRGSRFGGMAYGV